MNEEGVSSKDVYYEGCLDGQMAERAAIVVWLRSWADRNGEVDVSGEIERGEHIRKSGKWVVPPPPREHRCEFPGAAKTFPNGVVWACACGTAWTNYPPHFTSYPNHGWVRSPENDVGREFAKPDAFVIVGKGKAERAEDGG
jgi:hypothetical protein